MKSQSIGDQTALEHIFLDFIQMKEFEKNPLIMKKAKGVWYEDINGKKYLDGLAGIFVVNIGHGNRRVIDAIHAQLEDLVFAPPLHSTNVKALELAGAISGLTPGDLKTLKFFSGGSEATEAAVKLAKQYHKQTGNPGKFKILSRYQSYHGATMGSLAASGTTKRKTPFEPFAPGYIKVFPPTCYRCPYGLNYPECDVLCASIVEKVVKEEDPATVAAFIVEPIGNTGGIITPPPEYFRILREICDKYNILLIFDEVITGFGRTGEWFAAQTFGTTPDIICMGKGISSGYTPMGGLAISDRVAKAFLGPGDANVEFAHGQTFGGNPLSCAIALANVEEMKVKRLPVKAKERGAQVVKRLEEMRRLGFIGDIRGRGLLVGVEFVRDAKTKDPFPSDQKFGLKVGKKALEKGLILRFDPNWIAFAPPLVITEDETDKMMDIFEESAREVLRSVG